MDPGAFAQLGEESFERGGVLVSHRNEITLMELWSGTTIPNATMKEALEKLRETTGIAIKTEQLTIMSYLCPLMRIKLGHYGVKDPEAWALTLDAVAGHIAGTRWPLIQEEVDMTAFLRNLRVAARFMGFEAIAD